uniref:transposase n=1 Tax=Halolactibacillus alkaliphilus TaxID=442899 RepID=UPI0027D9750C|nr:transposase [Halolactibacillus alkaliphilus]
MLQRFFKAAANRNFDANISSYMKTSIKTLREHLPHIQNSFNYTYNNGRIEGINNKIKVLNRVAYGYRNFTNYKNRILLHFAYKPVEPQKKNTLKLMSVLPFCASFYSAGDVRGKFGVFLFNCRDACSTYF